MNNYKKYTPYPSIDLSDRTWPNKRITHAPIWCSVDLRDGNQALDIPMSVEEKLKLFALLAAIGFKEIEIGFPSASNIEYEFVRTLIEEKRIPKGVTIQVLTQARDHLIRRTLESLQGAPQAIIHMYNSTSTAQRKIVFQKNKEEIKKIAIEGIQLIKSLVKPSPHIRLEYSPESFTGTELDYALEVCNAVIDVWQPTPAQKLILNLPATVEMSTPNMYADRIEWFCRHVAKRDSVIISVHTHNDQGTAVAAAELAVMAGAERVEGALFGNGERSGNMDLVTMALNLFSQGVDPELDFSDINQIIRVYNECTRMHVHPRHPYAGELVYTAFSGSHQDAINKGMKAHMNAPDTVWDVPYLPIDPKDVGRTYEAIIRINSQSGKGGIAYVMEKDYHIQIPKWMQPDFGHIIQEYADKTGKELSSEQIYTCFKKAYLESDTPYHFEACDISTHDIEGKKKTVVDAVLIHTEKKIPLRGQGQGPVDAFVHGVIKTLGISFSLEQYAEHAISHGSEACAIAFIQLKDAQGNQAYGAGIDDDISIASMKAVISAINRLS